MPNARLGPTLACSVDWVQADRLDAEVSWRVEEVSGMEQR